MRAEEKKSVQGDEKQKQDQAEDEAQMDHEVDENEFAS